MTTLLLASLLHPAPAQAHDPEFETGTYTWSQGQGPVTMLPTAEHVCVLTRISGHFEGSGESVRLFQSGGYWQLHGSSRQSGVSASSTCFRMSAFQTSTGQERWLSDEHTLPWTPGSKCRFVEGNGWWGDSATFLTGMSGKFKGTGEFALVEQSGTGFAPSRITGNSCQAGPRTVRAHSFFAGAPHSGQPALFIGPNDNTGPFAKQHRFYARMTLKGISEQIMAPTDTAMCYLAGVEGKFRGAGEFVDIIPRVVDGVERWILRASNRQKLWDGMGVTGFAHCYARTQS